MYCPECAGEFLPGVSECPDCRLALVEALPSEDHPELELVPVLSAGNPAIVLAAESLLAQASIPFEKTGDGLQDLFGAGRLGTGFNILVGPVVFRVPKDHAADARAVLEDLQLEPNGDCAALEEE